MESISVVIPVLNGEQTIERAVESILSQQGVEVVDVTLAVGPSADRSRSLADALADRHRQVQVVDNPSGRTPTALNLAIAAGRGTHVARVDAQSELPDGYLAEAQRSLLDVGAANIAAVQRPVGVRGTSSAIAAAMASLLGSGGASYRRAGKLAPADTGYLGFFRRSALDDVGGFDERFVRNQDAELNARLNKAGHEVWLNPRLEVSYRPRSTFAGLARQYFQYGWWRRRMLAVHSDYLKARQLAPVLVTLVLGAAAATSIIVGRVWPLVAVAAYAVVLLAQALLTANLSPVNRLRMAAALAVMHLCWGSGFVASTLQKLVSRK